MISSADSDSHKVCRDFTNLCSHLLNRGGVEGSRTPTDCLYKDGLPLIIFSFFYIAFNSSRSIYSIVLYLSRHSLYHIGPSAKSSATPQHISASHLSNSSCIGTDLISITGVVIMLYQTCTLPQYDARRTFGLSLWVYPTLSVALIGLSLLVGEHFFSHIPRGGFLLLVFTLLVLTLAATAVSLVL